MTIEDFRAKMRMGPSADELKAGFEKRIEDIANKAIDEREDFRKMKEKISNLEKTVEKLQSALDGIMSAQRENE